MSRNDQLPPWQPPSDGDPVRQSHRRRRPWWLTAAAWVSAHRIISGVAFAVLALVIVAGLTAPAPKKANASVAAAASPTDSPEPAVTPGRTVDPTTAVPTATATSAAPSPADPTIEPTSAAPVVAPPAPVHTQAAAPPPAPVRTRVAAPVHTQAPPPPATNNCDPSYPGVCLHDGIGDYDCAGGSGNGPNYVTGPVTVRGSDPFGLDNDHNGVGCES